MIFAVEENEKMDDYISRQAAIRSVCEKECRVLKPCNAECGSVITLRELPSAQPKMGKWINRKTNVMYPKWERYTCSVCGRHSERYNFCPHCGARMEGSEE